MKRTSMILVVIAISVFFTSSVFAQDNETYLLKDPPWFNKTAEEIYNSSKRLKKYYQCSQNTPFEERRNTCRRFFDIEYEYFNELTALFKTEMDLKNKKFELEKKEFDSIIQDIDDMTNYISTAFGITP